MYERVKNFIFYGGTDRESYNSIKEKIEKSNRFTALIFASVAVVLISIMLALSFVQEGLSSSQPIYVFGLLLSVLLVIVALLSKWFHVLTYFSVYMSLAVFMIYGISIATLSRPEEQTVTFMVLLIFVPLIFVDRPFRMALNLIVYIIAFIVLAFRTKTGSVLSVDVTDAIIFGLLALISESIINRIKIHSYVLERQLHIMSETDQLTGLNNRNCYEWRLESYPSLCKRSICCIYIDVNGLHELNNNEGHKSGDDMLRCIADVVIRQFGSRDTYRIGGDEYVAFAPDVPLDEIEKRLEQMKAEIAEHGYHAAVGYEFSDVKNVNMNNLIVVAESRMYKDKSDYYKQHDRRSRR